MTKRKIRAHKTPKRKRPRRRLHTHSHARRVPKKIERKSAAQTKKEIAASKAAVAEAERAARVNAIIKDVKFSDFIVKNVGRKAMDVLRLLNNPKTDDALSAGLEIKINEVRRMLNVLGTYGIARYHANKDEKGWLTFEWYLDAEKLFELHGSIESRRRKNGFALPDNCNDFFYCAKCYNEQKVIVPFDAAFESQFKCENCGKMLSQLSRESAVSVFQRTNAA